MNRAFVQHFSVEPSALRTAGADRFAMLGPVFAGFGSEPGKRMRVRSTARRPRSQVWAVGEPQRVGFREHLTRQPTPPTDYGFEPIEMRDGWQVADNIVLSDFVVTPEGLVADAARNGVPLSTTVAPGDGTVHTRTATESREDFTGQATFTVRAFELFDDELRIIIDVDNQTNADARLSFDSYVLEGTQYPASYLGDASTETKPTVKRTVAQTVDAPRGGGTLTIDTVVGMYSSPDAQFVVAVPALG